MDIGEGCHCVGTVRDVVKESTLIVTDDGREYWFLSQHVAPLTEAPAATEPGGKPAAGSTHPSGTHTAPAHK